MGNDTYLKSGATFEFDEGGISLGFINISDSWKTISEMKINISDNWKTVSEVKINVGDSWKNLTT